MASLNLSGKQKKIVKQRVKDRSLEAVAREFNVAVEDLEQYLRKVWGDEKFSRVVEREVAVDAEDSGEGIIGWKTWQTRIKKFSFREWWRDNKQTVWWLIILGLLVYVPFIGNAFVSDDIFGIVDETGLGTWEYIWRSPQAFVRPMLYSMVYWFFGKLPFAFRLINILSHLGMIVGVYLLAGLLMGKFTARIMAILVAVHPIMLESVIWISAGAHSQYSFLVVVAMILYVVGRERKRAPLMIASWSCFLGALLFSEKAIIFPVLITVFELLWRQAKAWRHALPVLFFLGLSIFWGLTLIGQLQPRMESLQNDFSSVKVENKIFYHIPVAITGYLELLVWPDRLTLYHSELYFNYAQYAMMLIIVLAIVVAILYGWWRARWHGSATWGWIAFWLSWFVISLGLTLLPTGVSWVIAERYAYLASVGIFAVMAVVFTLVWRKFSSSSSRMVVTIIGLLIIASLMIRSYVRAYAWRTADSLWLATERVSPTSAQNNNNLGDLYARRGDFDRAIFYFTRATELSPEYVEANYNLATTYMQIQDFDTAIELFEQVSRWRPGFPPTYIRLSQAYMVRGEPEKALAVLERGKSENPSNPIFDQAIAEIQQQPPAPTQ